MVFTYKTAKENLPELMGELAESASNPKFVSNVTNEKIDMFKRIVGDDVYIVLDIYFIVSLKMGVSGAALATLIAQIFSALGIMIYVLTVSYTHLRAHET